MTSSPEKNVWLITGCSSGLGKAIALAALQHGDIVVATSRSTSDLRDLASLGAITASLDVTASDAALQKTVADILSRTDGRIDILVNNAGYFLAAGVEEASRDEVQAAFATNVFGQLNVLRAVMPHVRRAGDRGRVAFMGSTSSWRGTPGGGMYSATKAACSVLAESLAAEVAHLGVKVTALELGYFRTDGFSKDRVKFAERKLEELRPALEPVERMIGALHGKQPGDPAKAGRLTVEALTGTGRCEGMKLPARLAVGPVAYQLIGEDLERMRTNMDKWAEIVMGTDFDE